MGPVPVRMVKGLSDPLILLRFPDITTHNTTDHHALQGLARLGPCLPGHIAPLRARSSPLLGNLANHHERKKRNTVLSWLHLLIDCSLPINC